MTQIIDISPVLCPNTSVFPGDEPFSISTSCNYDLGHSYMLSSMRTTLHAGAHADAPIHYDRNGEDIASRSLHFYFGPCQVVEVDCLSAITVKDLSSLKISAPRVLIKTPTYCDVWNSDFAYLDPLAMDYLASLSVILVGIDTPSIDPASAKELKAHSRVYAHNMAILENLDLRKITPDFYTLCAFPLKIKGGDASPVRAVLIDLCR